jgi:hypothetical protein
MTTFTIFDNKELSGFDSLMPNKFLLFIGFNWLRLKILFAKFLLKRGIIPAQLRSQFAPNPLLKYPRNEACWCGSGEKAKKCCIPKQAPVCMLKHADVLTQYMNHIKIASLEPTTESKVMKF